MAKTFVVPGTERIDTVYSVLEDRQITGNTALLAVVTDQDLSERYDAVVEPRRTKDGHWFGLFRVLTKMLTKRVA